MACIGSKVVLGGKIAKCLQGEHGKVLDIWKECVEISGWSNVNEYLAKVELTDGTIVTVNTEDLR